jgi:hypothetical protein
MSLLTEEKIPAMLHERRQVHLLKDWNASDCPATCSFHAVSRLQSRHRHVYPKALSTSLVQQNGTACDTAGLHAPSTKMIIGADAASSAMSLDGLVPRLVDS